MRAAQFIAISVALVVMAGITSAAQPPKSKPKFQPVSNQPFTYGNVVAHFKDAGLRTTEVQKRCTIFFEGKWKSANIYDYCVI
ncbi:MAG TPA: hypothetical protein VFQ78_05580, partial [Candidatus Udaeobacter sp.]|nr:hypothetical protein [Candidatus Udaeobacter sp.]